MTMRTASSPATSRMDELSINTIRILAMDAVQEAGSGHPGTPMAMAPVAYCLWQRFLRFDPEDPIWPNRDRYGASAPLAALEEKFAFTPERIVSAKEQVRRASKT